MRTLIAILILVVISMTSCKFIEQKGWFGKKKVDPVAVMMARRDSIRVADSIRAEIEKMKAIEQARLDAIVAEENARLEMESRFKYHIIVGSFLTPQYAEDHKVLYKSMGYDVTIVPDSRGRFNLVSAELHETMSKAFSRLQNFQDTVDFEAWLFVRD